MIRGICAIGLALALVVTSVGAGATSRDRDQALAIARRLLSEGKQAEALARLEAIYEKSPDDAVIVKVYADVLIKVEKYDKAEEILTSYLRRHPQEFRLKANLALVNLLQDDSKQAARILDEIIAAAPKEEWPYSLVMNVLSEVDDHDGILEVIGRARRAVADSTLFTDEAVRLYVDSDRFREAVHEYLLQFAYEKRAAERVANRILDLSRDAEGEDQIVEELIRAKQRHDFAKIAYQVLWQLYLSNGDCEQAWAELDSGVSRFPELARQLPLFARSATEKHCYRVCAKAYGLIANLKQLGLNAPEILLEKARCEYMAHDLGAALETYANIAERFEGTQWGWNAVGARARIYQQAGRYEEAIAEASKIIENARSGRAFERAIAIKGDCLIHLGDLEEAFETYDLVELEWEGATAQEAFFNLGEIRLYQGEFEEAGSYYNVALREYPQENLANDCIERLMLLKTSKAGESYPPELKRLARALLLERQGKLDEAMQVYMSLSNTVIMPIKVESLRRVAEIHRKTGHPELAIETYRFIGDSLETYVAPAALEAIGDIYVELGEIEKARGVYENLILRFPESVAAGEARRKIDLFRSRQSSGS